MAKITVGLMTKLLVLSIIFQLCVCDYWSERQQLIELESNEELGASLRLNDKEHLVNKLLTLYKQEEVEAGLKNASNYLAAQHFFKAKTLIEQSNVFLLIKQLPKGASLHNHDLSMASSEFVHKTTFEEDLYARWKGGRIEFHVFENGRAEGNWTKVKDLRQNVDNFQEILKSQLTIIRDRPYDNCDEAWYNFGPGYETITSLLSYKKLFKKHFYESLKEMDEDGISYLEFRCSLPQLYDLQNNLYDSFDVIKTYLQTLEEFLADHPSFYGARCIYSGSRLADNKTADEYLKTALELKGKYPDFIAGFDMTFHEDKANPIAKFYSQLKNISEYMDLYLHAGETNWFGTRYDNNLIDAVLLKSKRIGHGFVIFKHPQVAKYVKENDVAVEICPISHQVLGLVRDLRNHPGSGLIAENYPVTICSDDVGFWGAKGISYDWYMAFMAMSRQKSDLKFLKQLAINSIKYSSLPKDRKEALITIWEDKWAQAMDDIILKYKLV